MTDLTWEDAFKNSSVGFIVGNNSMGIMLNQIGNELDEEGYVIDSLTKKRVLSQDEGEVKLKDLGTISSGSKNFIKKNIASYSEFLSQKRK
jgi:hypothetical protein